MHTSLAGTAPMPTAHSVGCAAPKSVKHDAPENRGEQDFSDTLEDSTQQEPSDSVIAQEATQPNKKAPESATTTGITARTVSLLQTTTTTAQAPPANAVDAQGTISEALPDPSNQEAEMTLGPRAPGDAQPRSFAQTVASGSVVQHDTNRPQQPNASLAKSDAMLAVSEQPQDHASKAVPPEPEPIPAQPAQKLNGDPSKAQVDEKTHQNAETTAGNPTTKSAFEDDGQQQHSENNKGALTPEKGSSGSETNPAASSNTLDTAQFKTTQAQPGATQMASLQSIADPQMDTSGQEIERVDRVNTEAPPQTGTDTAKTILRPAVEQARGISMQLAEAVQRGHDGSIDISLRPEELGRLRMSLQPGDGTMHIVLQADRAETMDLLRRHIATLQQEFLAMGYENFSFEFSSNDNAQSESGPETQEDSVNDDVTGASGAAPSPQSLHRYAGGLDLRV